jgi:mannose-6-phosphate isomerase-like protein (cupin superfamily)
MKTVLSIFLCIGLWAIGCATGKPLVVTGIDSTDMGPSPWVADIEDLTLNNTNFRSIKWTGSLLQLSLMSIPVNEEIGLETHPENDQFFRVEHGKARILMGPSPDNLTVAHDIGDDWIILIPAGYWHNIINIGDTPLKIYTLYAPPEHPDGTVHVDRAAAEADEHPLHAELNEDEDGDATAKKSTDDNPLQPGAESEPVSRSEQRGVKNGTVDIR